LPPRLIIWEIPWVFTRFFRIVTTEDTKEHRGKFRNEDTLVDANQTPLFESLLKRGHSLPHDDKGWADLF
jgi:hypothetical protein